MQPSAARGTPDHVSVASSRFDPRWLLPALLLLACGWQAQRGWSATFDEPLHLHAARAAAGGSLAVNPEHPALLKRLIAPLVTPVEVAAAAEPAAFSEGWTAALRAFDAGGRAELPRGRAVVLAHGALLVLVLAWLGGRLGGRWLGVAAGLLLALEPNLQGHAALVTYDVPATAYLTAAAVALGCGAGGGWGGALLIGGLLGAALSSKHAALPGGAALLAWWALRGAGPWRARALRLAAAALAAAALVALIHGGTARYASSLEGVLTGQSARPQQSYLLGELRRGAGLLYFPLALGSKLPLALQVLALAGALALWRGRRQPATAARWRAIEPLLVAALATALVIVARGEGLGVRYLLLAIPALAALAVAGLAEGRGRLLLAGGLALLALECATHGDRLGGFNALARGPGARGALLADSNLDWGQDLPALARWQAGGGRPLAYLLYFGTDDPRAYGLRLRTLPSFGRYLLDGRRSGPDGALPPRPADGLLAASANHALGLHAPPGMYAPLAARQPVARLGSIWLYALDDELRAMIAAAYWRTGDLPRLARELREPDAPLAACLLAILATPEYRDAPAPATLSSALGPRRAAAAAALASAPAEPDPNLTTLRRALR